MTRGSLFVLDPAVRSSSPLVATIQDDRLFSVSSQPRECPARGGTFCRARRQLSLRHPVVPIWPLSETVRHRSSTVDCDPGGWFAIRSHCGCSRLKRLSDRHLYFGLRRLQGPFRCRLRDVRPISIYRISLYRIGMLVIQFDRSRGYPLIGAKTRARDERERPPSYRRHSMSSSSASAIVLFRCETSK